MLFFCKDRYFFIKKDHNFFALRVLNCLSTILGLVFREWPYYKIIEIRYSFLNLLVGQQSVNSNGISMLFVRMVSRRNLLITFS